MSWLRDKSKLPSADEALPGRKEPMQVAASHAVLGGPLAAPPERSGAQSETDIAMFGLGCFWGAERKFWEAQGVVSTAVGYAAGHTPNPAYEEVCSGMTGHNEVVLVAFDPARITYKELLRIFWESHDPTQGMQQGNDRGTQYRSGIYTYSPGQREEAIASREGYAKRLAEAGHPDVTTEILDAPPFYYAEDYHQQYLHKNPMGYCGLGGTGVSCAS